MPSLGYVVLLNGAPRSGKSSIAKVIQEQFSGCWMNLGVDVFGRQVTPPRYQPGIGLRPGGERPDLEAIISPLYAAFFESMAAHSRQGLNVVADIGLHEAYSGPMEVVAGAATRLADLPVLFVGVHCPMPIVLERRAASRADRDGTYECADAAGEVPAPVTRWQLEVHRNLTYDLEVDTSVLSSAGCAQAIAEQLAGVTTSSSALHRRPHALSRQVIGPEGNRPR